MNPPVPCHLYASLNPCLLTELTPVNFHCASLLGMIFLFSFSTFGHTALHTGDLQFPGKGSNPCSCVGSTESSTTELPGKYHRQVLILLLYMATILYIYIYRQMTLFCLSGKVIQMLSISFNNFLFFLDLPMLLHAALEHSLKML